MKNKMKLKTIALSLGLATMMLPASAMAQKTTVRPGGLFGLNDQYGISLVYQKQDLKDCLAAMIVLEQAFCTKQKKRKWISSWKSKLSKRCLWVAASPF